MPNTSPELQPTAAAAIACALVQQFPGSQIIHNDAVSYGWVVEIMLPQAIHPEMFPFLEENIQRALAKAEQSSPMEMIADNASHLLKDLGQTHLAQALENDRQLITLLKSITSPPFAPVLTKK